MNGQAPERDAYMEFLAQFNTQERDANVTYEEFEGVHRNLSGAIQDLADYEATIRGMYQC